MDSVLVLTLIFLLIRQTFTDVLPQQICANKMCPSGYYYTENNCDDGALKCEKCKEGLYTAMENKVTECKRCTSTCWGQDVIVKNCTFTSDLKCGCPEGTFSSGGKCSRCWSTDNQTCEHCKREECRNHQKCKKKCIETTNTTPTPTTTSPSAPAPLNTSTTISYVPWVILLLMVVMAFLLLVFLIRNLLRYLHLCPCWSADKDVKFSEQQSHLSSSPTTLTITNSEETPMMTLSPNTPEEHPAHVSPLLPNGERKTAREEEHWPAIVLYTIIKEVPLRRWKEFLRLLSVADQQLERVELEAGLGSMERQYQMLRLWSQRSSANLDDVFSTLCYMDLSGCAQLLMESLEKLQWKPEQKQGVTASRGYTVLELTGAMQDV